MSQDDPALACCVAPVLAEVGRWASAAANIPSHLFPSVPARQFVVVSWKRPK